ncbi:single-stranded DNA-binding protein [Candidatus Gottesmanbacteria bacterium]|nr:single-stranded DNA-binding protein [Candidatus Gottesmanbacteria bacterium]
MSVRSLNKVMLIGNLTRDPELRYTPAGTAVCSFGLATNRSWTTESGEKKEETEFHRIVSWNKLAELCSQLLVKGRKVFVEGRLQTRSWQTQDGQQRQTTEVVIDDMIVLESLRRSESDSVGTHEANIHRAQPVRVQTPAAAAPSPQSNTSQTDDTPQVKETATKEEINPDDIPF